MLRLRLPRGGVFPVGFPRMEKEVSMRCIIFSKSKRPQLLVECLLLQKTNRRSDYYIFLVIKLGFDLNKTLLFSVKYCLSIIEYCFALSRSDNPRDVNRIMIDI